MHHPKPDPGKINCIYCGGLNVEGCEECRRCLQCKCYCRLCVSCKVKHHPKYFCRYCKYCKRHNDVNPELQCSCRKAPSYISKPIVTAGNDLNTLKRLLGLEIECSFIGKQGALELPSFVKSTWVHDGSVTAGGMELVVNPLGGDDFLRGIWAISEELNKYGFKADESCGLHVHVQAKDFDAWSLRRLILLYHHFEDLFYGLVKPGRDQGREVRGEMKYYAKRWQMSVIWYNELRKLQNAHDIRFYIMKWLYPNNQLKWTSKSGKKCENSWLNFPDIRAHKYEKARYYGLNLHTFFQRQTVEFRHHEGTIDPIKLEKWPLWCGWFVELASSLRDDEVVELMKKVEGAASKLLEGKWERLYHTVQVPEQVKEWVWDTLKERGRL